MPRPPLACRRQGKLHLMPTLLNILQVLEAKAWGKRIARKIARECKRDVDLSSQEQWAISLGCYIANLEVALARCAHPLLLAYAAAGNLLLQVLLLPHLARFFCW